MVPRQDRHNRCPIVDTWWQTETGAILIAPIPGAVPTKPGSATRPFFGIQPEVVTKEGEPVPPVTAACSSSQPWPSMARTVYGTPSATKLIGVTFPAATSPATARARTPMATSGSWAASTMSSTSRATVSAPWKSSPPSWPTQGRRSRRRRPSRRAQGPGHRRLCLPRERQRANEALKDELRKWVSKEIGSLARPDDIRFTEALPKPAAAKIMRRLLRELATHGEIKATPPPSKTSP